MSESDKDFTIMFLEGQRKALHRRITKLREGFEEIQKPKKFDGRIMSREQRFAVDKYHQIAKKALKADSEVGND